MKTWTNQAEQRLTEYLDERIRREGFFGEDGDELKEDLRSHIHEEAEKLPGENIGLMQLEGILSNLDAGYRPATPYKPTPLAVKAQENNMAPKPWRSWGAWVWGVVLPIAISLFELVAAFCGGVFFDPLATWWHTAMVFSVPAINWWLLKGAPRGSERRKGVAMGFALFISVFYALLFVPLLPASAIALIFFGMGLLSLMPVMAGITTWRISRAVRRESRDQQAYSRGRLAGIGMAALALLLLEGPGLWTRANLMTAKNGEREKKEALERLRFFHSPRALLLACYENRWRGTGGTDISGWIAKGWNGPAQLFDLDTRWDANPELAQELYFRVTGLPFNAQKPPRTTRPGPLGRGESPFNEVEFDSHLGGDQVAVRVKDLDMAESRFDGHVDARSQLGYGEWTMVFKNSGLQPKEARCQVLMPRGGRVSRLTLWVNGEPREAAFNSVSKVKAAYKAIAVVQRRDPVLVTMSGPDIILVQCFPVPQQGEMKIRFGITAPLDQGQWELPRILERNFGTSDSLDHSVWLQADSSFNLASTGVESRSSVTDGPGFSLSASLKPEAAMSGLTAVRMADPAPPAAVWCEDKFAAAYERYLIREPKPSRTAPAKVLLVVDGSASMAKAKPWIVESLKNDFPADAFRILVADDKATPVKPAELEDHDFSGGRDNEPALREAVRMAKSGEVDEIVWLHGPQAAGLSQPEALLQLIERGTRQPVIHTVMAESGPNRLAEALQRSGALRRGAALFEPRKDFSAFIKLLMMDHERMDWHWKRSPQPPTELGTPVWDHLARHWAIEAVESKQSLLPEIDKPATAAKYQLVTSVSGAVVLETMEQYKQHGLEPVSAADTPQIPGVPEPSSVLLVMISAAAMLTRRRRQN